MGENEWKKRWSSLREGLLSVLFPRAATCLCCGHPRKASLEDCLCPDCRKELSTLRVPAQACHRCLSPVRKGKRCTFCHSPFMKELEAVYAPYRYVGAVRLLVHAFKFNACDEALPLLAQAMVDSLIKRDFDCIVPVPLHPKRLRQRGVNQALLLAQAMSAKTGIPTRELLQRTRYHKPQSRTAFSKRRRQVEGAFSPLPGGAGQRVLLVDDVRTSGSTSYACARALKAGGAASVSLCVFAVVYRRMKVK